MPQSQLMGSKQGGDISPPALGTAVGTEPTEGTLSTRVLWDCGCIRHAHGTAVLPRHRDAKLQGHCKLVRGTLTAAVAHN